MTETLTCRERILKVLNHEEPGRVPMDLGGTHDSSIVVEGYERLNWVRTHTDAPVVLTLPAPCVHLTQFINIQPDV
ncbi:MAG: hypothetical protein HY895_19455 [Deltaproteobacteria bacterium]|nr:hypothetical protein [Deltaproteobacteria bacterium]